MVVVVAIVLNVVCRLLVAARGLLLRCLLVVVGCSLFGMCSVLVDVRWLMFAACCMVSVVCCLLFAGC